MSDKEKEATAEVQDPASAETDNAAGGETPDHAELMGLLEDERAKADEHWNQILRLQAELENLQKRAARDLENAHKFGLEKIAQELLPVRDSMEMGVQAATEGGQVDPAKLLEGMELTLKMLTDVMNKFNIREINPVGEKFNPELHQAMSMQEAPDKENNTVLNVIQKGYTLNDRLIRPALVVVSKGGGKTDQAGDTQHVDEQA